MTADPRLAALAAVAASILVGAAGQVLLKQGMDARGPVTLAAGRLGRIVWDMLRNGRLLAGMGLYAVSAAGWLYGLARVDLSYAYPLLAANLVLVALGARLVLREPVPPLRWAGIALISLGIVLVAAS